MRADLRLPRSWGADDTLVRTPPYGAPWLREGASMSLFTRGFHGRRSDDDGRLPPGQYLTDDFPVLSAGPTPQVPLDRWAFTIRTESGDEHAWSWAELTALPTESV